MNQQTITAMETILGKDFVMTDLAHTSSYFYDEVEEAYRPQADERSIVVKPCSTDQVSQMMKYANENRIPVVVRGGGTGLCGGCTPIFPSLILSMERMNQILEIDEENMAAVMQAGVSLAALLEELEGREGIGFPVHPGDEGAQMGGMAVTNAGGARAVRHGVMRKHILGLEVVLANGTVLELGGKLIKNNAGYNLMQLMLGSEGTLAVVTQVTLKLYPEAPYSATIVAPFPRFEDACAAVLKMLRKGVSPLAVEYMDQHLFVGTAEMLGLNWQAKEGDAALLIILSEQKEELLFDAVRQVNEICEENHSYETLYAGRKEEQEELLRIRSQHYEYIKHEIYDSFDMAVPLSEIPAFIGELKALAAQYQTRTNVIAHIADGNVHNDILYVDGQIPSYGAELKEKMYTSCFRHGGTITGEHGVGKIRVEDLKLQKKPAELDLMRGIKAVFDPLGILNPGTVVEIHSETHGVIEGKEISV